MNLDLFENDIAQQLNYSIKKVWNMYFRVRFFNLCLNISQSHAGVSGFNFCLNICDMLLNSEPSWDLGIGFFILFFFLFFFSFFLFYPLSEYRILYPLSESQWYIAHCWSTEKFQFYHKQYATQLTLLELSPFIITNLIRKLGANIFHCRTLVRSIASCPALPQPMLFWYIF